MKRLLLIFVLLASALRAATGDVSVTIRPDGFSADVAIEGFTAGTTFDFDMGTNNVPGASTPYFTVVSLGYDNTGSATTITRTVYFTPRGTNLVMRLPFSTATQAGGTWSGVFEDGETITCSTSGATAIVVGNQSSGPVLRYKNLSGVPLITQTWTGGTSGATFVNTSNTVTTLTQPTNDELVTATGVVVRVSLSDYIFQKDNSGGGNSGTAPTVTIPSGWATNTGGGAQTSNALTAAAVTQSSTAAYQAPVANWAELGWNKFTAASKLRAVAFHGSGQQGRPVRVVKFTVTDGSTTNTEYVTAPTYDSSYGDATPVVEYLTTTDLTSGLTQGATLTCNFVAYPWVGDVVKDTGDGTNSNATTPTPLYAPILQVCDKTGAYCESLAVVDPVGGNDGTAVVSTVLATAEASPYLTMAAAFNGLRSYNNTNYSRNNAGGSVMYLRTGNNAFVNGAVTLGTTPDAYLTVTRHPSDARSGVIIVNNVTGASLGLRLKLLDLTFNTTSGNTVSPGGNSALWVDQCTLSSSGGVPIYQNRVWAITRSTVTTNQQWFRQNGTENWSCALIRGNTMTFTSGTNALRAYCVLGNKKTGISTAAFSFQRFATSQTVPACDNWIIAFNALYGINTTSASAIPYANDTTCTQGGALVQNVFEQVESSAGGALIAIAADGSSSTSDPNNNIIVWNNTLVGQRLNRAYNDTGSNAPVRSYWSVKNNVIYDDNLKTDIFPAENGMRINNWSQENGVSASGNLCADSGNGFSPEFGGLGTLLHDWSGSTFAVYGAFVDYKAYTGSGGDGAGGGDYAPTASSPFLGLQRDLVIPYDLAGEARSTTDAAGAYRQDPPSTGASFWWSSNQ